MNNAIINNWNKTVVRNDIVYFLGDYTGPTSRRVYFEKFRYWTENLRGY
jgi:calcineurin-like phosphoesterase family protein